MPEGTYYYRILKTKLKMEKYCRYAFLLWHILGFLKGNQRTTVISNCFPFNIKRTLYEKTPHVYFQIINVQWL